MRIDQKKAARILDSDSRRRDHGVFTRLRAEFVLGRRVKYFLMNLYIPSTMCVLVSWISFWIKVEIAPARVTLGVTTFLAISGSLFDTVTSIFLSY